MSRQFGRPVSDEAIARTNDALEKAVREGFGAITKATVNGRELPGLVGASFDATYVDELVTMSRPFALRELENRQITISLRFPWGAEGLALKKTSGRIRPRKRARARRRQRDSYAWSRSKWARQRDHDERRWG